MFTKVLFAKFRAKLVTHRRSYGERLQNLKFHNNPNTANQDKGIYFPNYYQIPINVTAGWAVPKLTPGHQVPI